MQEESLHGGWNKYSGTKDLLYIDAPKYIREEKRFLFNDKDHMALLDMLMDYEGNWILVWKMYIEKPADATITTKEQDEATPRDRPYEEIYNKNSFLGEKELGQRQQQYKRTIELRELVNILRAISSESRQLKVFRYRDKNKNMPNSIVFITNIDIHLPDANHFQAKYQLKFEHSGRLDILSIDEFYKNYSPSMPSYIVQK